MKEESYILNELLTKWEAHPPITILGSSPPQKLENYAVYLDFDNIYSGLLDFLNIRVKNEIPTKLQTLILKEVLKCLIYSLSIYSNDKAKYIKAFAEYENLPHKSIFKPNIQAFLYNLGVKPVNPFVAYSNNSGKGKNASDIALSLEVVSDILIKENPINTLIIASGDIDLYPLISWIREYTNKKIFIASFKNRLNPIYKQVIDLRNITRFDGVIYDIIFLDEILLYCFISIVSPLIEKLIQLDENIIRNVDLRSIDWLKSNIKRLKSEYRESKFQEFIQKDFSQVNLKIYEKDNESCDKFKDKLIKGLRNWLKTHDSASTGLIITSWLPRWNINFSLEEANECLIKIIEDLENLGFKFEGKIRDNEIIGKFFIEE
jgi:hypothetical protein